MSARPRLAACFLASLGLHLGLFAGTASLFLPPTDHFLRDASRGPRLEVTLLAAAPPAFAVDAALPPMAEALRVFSRRAAKTEPPGARRESAAAKTETIYHSAREVDVRAVPLTEIVPVNPDLTGQQSGRIVLRLLINAAGAVENVLVVEAEPPTTFGQEILLPFQRARFLPARKAGIAVNSEMLIELRYGALEEGRP